MLNLGIVCSYAFALPVATAPNAIVFGHSTMKTTDMMKVIRAIILMNFVCVFNICINCPGWTTNECRLCTQYLYILSRQDLSWMSSAYSMSIYIVYTGLLINVVCVFTICIYCLGCTTNECRLCIHYLYILSILDYIWISFVYSLSVYIVYSGLHINVVCVFTICIYCLGWTTHECRLCIHYLICCLGWTTHEYRLCIHYPFILSRLDYLWMSSVYSLSFYIV